MNHVLDDIHIGTTWQIHLNDPCLLDISLVTISLATCYSVTVICCRMLSHLLVDKVCQCYSKLKLFMDTLTPSAVTLVSL